VKDQLNIYINSVLEFYNSLGTDRILNDHFQSQGGCNEWVFARLHRAAIDQANSDCRATDSRYAIWAADIKEILLGAESKLKENNVEEAIRNINLAINALSAYIDIKALFDSACGMQFNTLDEIIGRYEEVDKLTDWHQGTEETK
jgi:hypothetical protein